MRPNLTKPTGATAVEYVIMLILVALVVMGIMRVFGNSISNKVVRATGGVETMADSKSGSSAKGKYVSSKGRSGKGANSVGEKGSASKGRKSGNGGQGSEGVGAAGTQKTGGATKVYRNSSGELEEIEKEGPGINPIVLLIALALIGLLIYVMTAKKE